MSRKKTLACVTLGAVLLTVGAVAWITHGHLRPVPNTLGPEATAVNRVQILDRNHVPLTVTYQNPWNVHDHVPLHAIPLLLQQAFILSEDQRFYEHSGVDWRARLNAVIQNIRALRAVRGASTLTEQVIRMWRPRPRTLWSRWLEGWEAIRLEKRFSKGQILECYLNQVPYAAQRRGVAQAALYYFDRDLDTLSPKEMLALAVMVRAPGQLNIHKNPQALERPIRHLARRLHRQGFMDSHQLAQLADTPVRPRPAPPATVDAAHFVRHLLRTIPPSQLTGAPRLRATLSAPLQTRIQKILDHRLRDMQRLGVHNGAVLVADHQQQEILAWVNAGTVLDDVPESWIDAVTTPRQPGSTLKPFLYALALEKGWTAATPLDDLPLAAPVGFGLHTYHNYSRTHYGRVPLRHALGNSLNTPAVRTIQFVGVPDFLRCLGALGIRTLQGHPDHYGEGLALGNGEITLLELVGAYAALASQGIYRPLRLVIDEDLPKIKGVRVFSPETSSLIAHILSDPDARRLEFGQGSLLRFPVQTAVKTGTSSDYRDAWAVGFNDQYTVGAWMGNLDHGPTSGMTGSAGPALILRSVFAELNRHRPTRPLSMSPGLVKQEICQETGFSRDGPCMRVTEWFVPGTEPNHRPVSRPGFGRPCLERPTQGLQLAMDPRIPDLYEAFQFQLSQLPEKSRVEWYVDGRPAGAGTTRYYLWPLSRGVHHVMARVHLSGSRPPLETASVRFVVK